MIYVRFINFLHDCLPCFRVLKKCFYTSRVLMFFMLKYIFEIVPKDIRINYDTIYFD